MRPETEGRSTLLALLDISRHALLIVSVFHGPAAVCHMLRFVGSK